MSEHTTGRQAPPADETAAPLPSVAEQLGEIMIEISTRGLTMGDLKLMARLRRGAAGGVTDEEALEFLGRVVVGGVDHLPFDAQPQIWAAVWREIYGGKRAKN